MTQAKNEKTVLITGATGFVGRGLSVSMLEQGWQVKATTRASRMLPQGVVWASTVHDIDADTDWAGALEGVDVVVHLAARVHVMADSSSDPLAEYRKLNVEGTLNLARQAERSGIKRFVFISSVKVNGEFTVPGHPFTADEQPAPLDPYGLSKYEAEQALLQLAQHSAMTVTIIRPPLIYGPGVKANFLSMMNWLNKGIPLPFGDIHNQRSLVALDNLCDLIITCCQHPKAANQIFLVSDGEDLTTTDLLRCMAQALHRPARLIPIPVGLLKTAFNMLGKKDLVQRLFGSLQVDITKTREMLDWNPPINVTDAFNKAAQHFKAHKR